MSVLGLVSEAIGAIRHEFRNSGAFFHDARRFILKNRHLAEIAPLQLYSSGLIFCPEGSITRGMFKDNLSTWSRLPKVEEFWSAEQQTLEGHSSWVWSKSGAGISIMDGQ
ncbi:hypothetical protein BDW71DRAFT_160417 [Aspergillus fruticulosus]